MTDAIDRLNWTCRYVPPYIIIIIIIPLDYYCCGGNGLTPSIDQSIDGIGPAGTSPYIIIIIIIIIIVDGPNSID